MAGRIRSIKPELLTDAKAARLSDSAWRCWVSCWLLADDTGRLPGDPTIVGGQVFPAKPAKAAAALDELVRAGLLIAYRVRSEAFLEIPGFKKHQKINRPSGPKFPAPGDDDGGLSEDSVSHQGALAEGSMLIPTTTTTTTTTTNNARGAEKPTAPLSPDALALADGLRDHIVAQKPDHELSTDAAWSRKRAAWAKQLTELLKLEGRTMARAIELLSWVFGDQGGRTEFRFRVDSPPALRSKWDAIELAMAAPKRSAAGGHFKVTGTEVYGDGEVIDF